jgi:alkylation response protein AidB-like acyl-CoA dehydrogenase
MTATGIPPEETRRDSGPSALERRLGDPFDPANPAGYAAVLAADDHGTVPEFATAVLDEWGAGSEFVPVSFGGRFGSVDELVRRLRPVFRRDASLGLGYGLTSLMAGLPVFTAGSGDQRDRVGRLLLAGRPVSVAFHELAHGNDLSASDLSARRASGNGDGWLVTGEKHVINNAGHAPAALVLARTGADDRPGQAHTLLLLDDLDGLPSGHFRRLPRFRTAGLAGCRLGGLRFDNCPVPAGAAVGRAGMGVPITLTAFQVSRCATAGAATSLLEAALDAVLRFARERTLYGRAVVDLPHARALLAGAYADLHLAQATAATAARALHLHPEGGARYAAAAKYLVPLVVEAALADLAVVLGARSYLREGDYAIVGKHLRDAAGVSIGHAGGVSCLLTVLGQLPGLRPARDPAVTETFTGTQVPELDFSRLRMLGSRTDPLLTTAVGLATAAAADPRHDTETRARLRSLAAAAADIGSRAAAVPPARRGVEADRHALTLADRYARLLAAAACLGRHAAAAVGDGAGDVSDAAVGSDEAGSREWLAAVLRRLAPRRGRSTRPAPPADAAVLLDRAATRTGLGLSLDLDPDPVVRPR